VSWWRRRESRHIPHEPSRIEGADPLADRADDVALTLAVREALARLAPRQRAVLVLRYFEDLSEARTAEILGISVGTVKSHARDGLARLRALAPDLDSVMEAQS
jgi:RNA polymerase sigma factor (sigma-70 family)